MTVYSEKKNATRAARKAAQDAGHKDPMAMVHFNVAPCEGGFAFDLIDPKTGEHAPDPDAALAASLIGNNGQRLAADIAARAGLVTICPAKPAGGVKAPRPPAPQLPNGCGAAPVQAVDITALPPARAPKAPPPIGKRAQILADAAAGTMPTPPTFSENPTWNACRKKLADVVALVEAGDVAALKALTIPTYDSGVKAIAKYRDLAVTAIEARLTKATAKEHAA